MTLAEKIRARLKAKYSGVNLSKKRIDAIAAKLAKKLTDASEDADIDTALEDINDITPFADIAKDDDRVRTLEAQKTKTTPAAGDDADDDEEVETVKTVKTRRSKDDPPAWAQALMQDIAAIKGEKIKSSIADKVKGHPKLKDVPEKFYNKRALPEREEEIDAFVEEIETDYTDFMQERIDSGLEVTTSKPILGSTNKEGVSSAVETYIASKSESDKPGNDLGGKKI